MVEENKKKRILEAALKLFVEKGIDNTSTSLISKEANIATGTLYLYFKNKVNLINELYVSLKEENLGLICLDVVSEIDFVSLEKGWMNTVSWGVSNPDKFRFMMQFDTSPYNTVKTQAKFKEHKMNIINLIKKGVENKQLKNLPPEYILEFISSHLVFTVEYIIETRTDERKMFYDTLIDALKY